MPTEINNREYRQIMRGMKDARELYQEQYYKEALLALRQPRRILESKLSPRRINALVYIQEAEVLIALKRNAKADTDLQHALEILDLIHDQDEELRTQIRLLQECTK